jgi:hypothetical protein
MKTHQVCVINASAADVRDVLFVDRGKLNVPGDIANNATNTGFAEEITWNLIDAIDVIDYSLGTYRTVVLNFDSPLHGWAKDTKYELTIRSRMEGRPWSQKFTVISRDIVNAETFPGIMTDYFYSILKGAESPLVVTKGTNKITIQGVFGVDQVSNEYFDIETPWVADATELVISGATIAADAEFTTVANHGLAVGDFVQFTTPIVWTVDPTAGVESPTHVYTVTSIAGGVKKFKCGFDSQGGTYGSGGGATETVLNETVTHAVPRGTKAIVDIETGNHGVTDKTYKTIQITHGVPVQTPPYGHVATKVFVSKVYVESVLYGTLGLYAEALLAGEGLPEMVVLGITKADPAVAHIDGHTLKAGDKIQVYDSDAPEANGNVFIVDSVKDADEVNLDYDSSGWTSAATSGKARMWNPGSLYSGR